MTEKMGEFQFGLRALLIVITIWAVLLSFGGLLGVEFQCALVYGAGVAVFAIAITFVMERIIDARTPKRPKPGGDSPEHHMT
jgi:hypothetical protein